MTGRPGTDRRAVRHRAPAGAPHAAALNDRPHATVVGAGVAGLAAATALAERGVHVDVIERERNLGGRVGSWTERLGDGTPVSMSRGFHAFFRQYYNLRGLLRRADPGLRRLVALNDYPITDAAGRRDGFRGLPRTPPWNALAFVLRSPTFGARDLLALDARAAAPLACVSVPGTYRRLDDVDAETFLRRVNFPAAARHLAFEVFSRSFFAQPWQLSAAELAVMFHVYFLGSSEGLLFDVPDGAYDASLWAPLREYLERLGVRLRTSTTVTGLDRTRSGFRVSDDAGRRTDTGGVVLATDIAGLQRIARASPDLDDEGWRRAVLGLRTAPPFLVQRLWLDRAVAPDRPEFLGTAGMPPLDNVSVLERYEHEAAQWARHSGGSVVELHAYAATVPPGAGVRGLRARLLDRLRALYPETATAGVVGESVQWHDDCPLLHPGSFATRPRVRTPFDGVTLAGDGIRIDLPVALMERAASTGLHAANCLLARWGLAGHELWSVPTAGRIAPLRRLASQEVTR